MQESKTSIILVLIVALVALGLSMYTTYSISQINKKIVEIDETVTEMKPIMEKFEPLLPQLEALDKLLPRMQQFLLGIPPFPVSGGEE